MQKLILTLAILLLAPLCLANQPEDPQVKVTTSYLYTPSGTIILQLRLDRSDKSWRLDKWALTLLKVKGAEFDTLEWKPDFPGFVAESTRPVLDNEKLDVEFQVEGDLCKGATCQHQKINGQATR
jgi:hypothetical protein